MKTRTLLLLSVGVGLAILLAGGLFFVQLANQNTAIEPAEIGDPVAVGDVEVTVARDARKWRRSLPSTWRSAVSTTPTESTASS